MGGGGRTDDGGRMSSVWWNNMKVVGDDVGEGVWRWIEDNIGCKVGNRSSTLF